MNISYTNYPSLLFLSYNKENAPQELPFSVTSKYVREHLAECKGYHSLFSYIAVKNSLEKRNTTSNYFLSESTFKKVEFDDNFRNEYFYAFFTRYIKPQQGTILFQGDAQYVYLLLAKHETKQLKNREGRYFAAALFKKNLFLGFEEGIITENGIDVLPSGYYEAGMQMGGYLSFCLITLSYASEKNLVGKRYDNIKEEIYKL